MHCRCFLFSRVIITLFLLIVKGKFLFSKKTFCFKIFSVFFLALLLWLCYDCIKEYKGMDVVANGLVIYSALGDVGL